MALTFVEYLLIDGQRYAVPADSSGVSSFKRHYQPIEPSQLSGLRVQSPFLDAEVQGFEDGEGLRTIDDVATGYYSGLGVEPHTEVPTTGHLRLKVGRQLTQDATQASAGGFRAMAVFNNELLLGAAAETKIYSWDGTTLTGHDYSAVSAGFVTGFAIAPDTSSRIYFTTSGGGLRWMNLAYAFFSASNPPVAGLSELAGTYQVIPTGDDLIWWTAWASVQDGLLYTWSRTAGTPLVSRHEIFMRTFITPYVFGGTVYYWSYDHLSAKQPSAELFTISAAGGGAPVATGLKMLDNYPTSVCAFRGDLYYGMAWGGSVRKLNGAALEEVLHVGATATPATVPGTDAIYAMTVYGDSLYVSGYDAAAVSGQRTWLRRYDGSGWHLISSGGNDLSTAIRALGAFQQTLMLGDDEVTNARLYSLSKTSRLTSAMLETPDAVFGATGTQKRYRRTTLQHSALIAGQAVEARYLLDSGAEVSLGTNKDVGSTETAFDLPVGVRGTRLRTCWYFTNVSGSDLIMASASVRCLPAPPSLEVWETTLQLASDSYSNKWSDATADSEDVLTKFERLRTLQQTGQVFQAVDQFRDTTDVKRAMLAVFDPQVPLEWTMKAGGTFDLEVPVRLLQAGQPNNMLVNASFEQDAAAASPTGWAALGTVTSALVSTAVTAQDGANVLAIIFNGTSASGRQQSVAGLIPGRYYTLSGYIRRTAGFSAGNVKLNAFESGILDVSTAVLASGVTDAAFIRYSVPFLLPLTSSGTIAVRFVGNTSPSGTVYFDAIQLEEGAPMSPFRELGAGG